MKELNAFLKIRVGWNYKTQKDKKKKKRDTNFYFYFYFLFWGNEKWKRIKLRRGERKAEGRRSSRGLMMRWSTGVIIAPSGPHILLWAHHGPESAMSRKNYIFVLLKRKKNNAKEIKVKVSKYSLLFLFFFQYSILALSK